MIDILAPGWLTTGRAQALTGYTVDHLQRLARGGQVTAHKIGDSWLFDRESLTTYQATVRPVPSGATMRRQRRNRDRNRRRNRRKD